MLVDYELSTKTFGGHDGKIIESRNKNHKYIKK